MLKFNPTTPILFYVKMSAYVPGQGPSMAWQAVIADAIYCEWKGSFGDRALSAQAMGVKDFATIRTFYHPVIYEALITKQAIVIKNADTTAIVNGEPDKNNSNVYELWGSVDNEENQCMEFKVRRYEVK